jgi:P-type conjugative transfer protein TrbJ
MTHLCIQRILIGMALAFAPGPAAGQMVVYDPSNYAQNVLQAARAMQQINNQVTSLQNQTQMLLNQVKNLTSLPYSALQTIDQSIVRTQRLLNQAQRIAYDINQIDQAFSRSFRRAIRSRPRPNSLPAMRRPGGRTRSRPTRTRCASKPASCRAWKHPGRKPTGSSPQANRPPASFKPARPAIS